MNQLIDKAARFAAVKHDGQYRKGSNIPYITHPFGVAMILMEEKQPEKLIAAALLHDTLEDTEATEEELFRNFGEDILMLVKAASEPDKTLSWEMRKQHTVSNLTAHSTEELHLILADKLHNLRSIQADAFKQGKGIWSRFNRGKRDQSWYYMSIVRAVQERKRDIPLIRKMEEETMELFTGKKRLSVHDIQLLFTSIHPMAESTGEDLHESGLGDFVAEVRASAETRCKLKGPERSAEALYEEAYLEELKYRLAWDDALYQKYVHHFYTPGK